MENKENIIEMENLRKDYFRTRALDNVSINIKRGKIIGLLGPNGSGKSTLLKTICGLVKPTAGSVLVDGKKPAAETRKNIAYLPEIDHLYAWMTVEEVLKFVATFYPDWQWERTSQLLEFMNLEKHKKVGNLSKGMKARLKLVIALSREVPLILLDEPLSGIDPPSRARILESILTEYRVGQQTVILSTHEVVEAESLFEDVVFLQDGKVKLFETAENLREQFNCSIQDLWEEVFS